MEAGASTRGGGERGGDWTCGLCGETNFARRTECFGCGVVRADAEVPAGRDGGGVSGAGGPGTGPLADASAAEGAAASDVVFSALWEALIEALGTQGYLADVDPAVAAAGDLSVDTVDPVVLRAGLKRLAAADGGVVSRMLPATLGALARASAPLAAQDALREAVEGTRAVAALPEPELRALSPELASRAMESVLRVIYTAARASPADRARLAPALADAGAAVIDELLFALTLPDGEVVPASEPEALSTVAFGDDNIWGALPGVSAEEDDDDFGTPRALLDDAAVERISDGSAERAFLEALSALEGGDDGIDENDGAAAAATPAPEAPVAAAAASQVTPEESVSATVPATSSPPGSVPGVRRAWAEFLSMVERAGHAGDDKAISSLPPGDLKRAIVAFARARDEVVLQLDASAIRSLVLAPLPETLMDRKQKNGLSRLRAGFVEGRPVSVGDGGEPSLQDVVRVLLALARLKDAGLEGLERDCPGALAAASDVLAQITDAGGSEPDPAAVEAARDAREAAEMELAQRRAARHANPRAAAASAADNNDDDVEGVEWLSGDGDDDDDDAALSPEDAERLALLAKAFDGTVAGEAALEAVRLSEEASRAAALPKRGKSKGKRAASPASTLAPEGDDDESRIERLEQRVLSAMAARPDDDSSGDE